MLRTTIKLPSTAKAEKKLHNKILASLHELHHNEISDFVKDAVKHAIEDEYKLKINEFIKNPSVIIHNILTMAGSNLNRAEQAIILIALANSYKTEVVDSYSKSESKNVLVDIVRVFKNDFIITVKDIEEMLNLDAKQAQQFLRNAFKSDTGDGLCSKHIVFNKNSPNFYTVIENIKTAYARDCLKLKITDRFERTAPWLESFTRDAGWVRFTFSQTALEMLPKDLTKGKFTSFKLKAALKLKSDHAVKLFMMMSMGQKYGFLKSNLHDVSLALAIPETYCASDAKKRFILPAIKEINDVFQINLTAEWTATPGVKSKTLDQVYFKFNGSRLMSINSGGRALKDRNANQLLAITESNVSLMENKLNDEPKSDYINDRVVKISDKLQSIVA